MNSKSAVDTKHLLTTIAREVFLSNKRAIDFSFPLNNYLILTKQFLTITTQVVILLGSLSLLIYVAYKIGLPNPFKIIDRKIQKLKTLRDNKK